MILFLFQVVLILVHLEVLVQPTEQVQLSFMIWLSFNLYLYWYFNWYPLLVLILVCGMLYCLNTGTGIVIPMLVLSNTGTVIVQAKSITHS